MAHPIFIWEKDRRLLFESTQIYEFWKIDLNDDMTKILKELAGEQKLDQYQRTGDLDTLILPGSRIRINAYMANEKRC